MEGGETPKKTGIGRFLDARARRRALSGRRKPWPGLLFVPRDLFLPLVALLRFQGHGRDGASLQPREGDRLSRHFAIAIFTFVDAAQRCVDLGDQLALAVTGTKLDRPIGLVRLDRKGVVW